MGGRVGLKGTDGEQTLSEAVRKGAKPVSPGRGLRFLEQLRHRSDRTDLITAPGNMGEVIANQLKIKHETIGKVSDRTTSEDTIRIASLMRQKADLIAFCGGDGTARDILKGVGQGVPVLGVPSGVKVYSSIFAITPVAAADSAISFLDGQVHTRQGEVVDVDEEAFRKDHLSVKLFGYLSTPDNGSMVQSSKSMTEPSEDENLESIADQVFETISPDTIYVMGPGSTVERIAKRLGVAKTLLGVDVIGDDGVMLGKDVDEQTLASLVKKAPVKIIVSPIGRQGFLFGRGNQQISADIVRLVGVENVVVVASRRKIESLRPQRLLVDSDDEDLDKHLRGYIRVISGYREERVLRVE